MSPSVDSESRRNAHGSPHLGNASGQEFLAGCNSLLASVEEKHVELWGDRSGAL